MEQEIEPGVKKLDWNEGRVRKERASVIFPLGAPDDDGKPVWSQFRYFAGEALPRHAHSSWTHVVVLEGYFDYLGERFAPGQLLVVEPNVQYGPFYPGPDGVTCIELFGNLASVAPIWEDPDDPEVRAMYDLFGDEAGLVDDPVMALHPEAGGS